MHIERLRNNTFKIVVPRTVKNEQLAEMRTWCLEKFGPGGRNKKCKWRCGWLHQTDFLYFKHEQHATMFALRWG